MGGLSVEGEVRWSRLRFVLSWFRVHKSTGFIATVVSLVLSGLYLSAEDGGKDYSSTWRAS